ncbi:hypothetical protein SODALDRAFT_378880 [Sodiomyces alkalinus F11]|uniref:Uncharacterized protein n=1 Tax=Sodiomyces alkalinus (strain CBS 110278 / VKM F-3762 / F11) TaxID=1314773 RepID=A0A3N2PW53_SODAK|nr:hypothetical protein SODALDRAFT_378880 [Sodiomyces alkalinus F11]ROT38718.1 hypothetical protein SODALDRAFT_378880 [Sodiomyces alkalinus F11]
MVTGESLEPLNTWLVESQERSPHPVDSPSKTSPTQLTSYTATYMARSRPSPRPIRTRFLSVRIRSVLDSPLTTHRSSQMNHSFSQQFVMAAAAARHRGHYHGSATPMPRLSHSSPTTYSEIFDVSVSEAKTGSRDELSANKLTADDTYNVLIRASAGARHHAKDCQGAGWLRKPRIYWLSFNPPPPGVGPQGEKMASRASLMSSHRREAPTLEIGEHMILPAHLMSVASRAVFPTGMMRSDLSLHPRPSTRLDRTSHLYVRTFRPSPRSLSGKIWVAITTYSVNRFVWGFCGAPRRVASIPSVGTCRSKIPGRRPVSRAACRCLPDVLGSEPTCYEVVTSCSIGGVEAFVCVFRSPSSVTFCKGHRSDTRSECSYQVTSARRMPKLKPLRTRATIISQASAALLSRFLTIDVGRRAETAGSASVSIPVTFQFGRGERDALAITFTYSPAQNHFEIGPLGLSAPNGGQY